MGFGGADLASAPLAAVRQVADLSPEWWTAIGTLATALVALAAAVIGLAQAREARRLRVEAAAPYVIVDIVPSVAWGNILNLVIENVGRTPAHDVSFDFSPPITTSLKDYDLAGSTLVQDGIPTLPPGRRISALFDVSHERMQADLPMRYEVTVDMLDARGKPQTPQRYVLDIAPLFGLQRVEEYSIHHVAKALREMNKTQKKWTGSRGRLNVWVKDEDDHAADERAHHFLTGHGMTLGRRPVPAWALALGRRSLLRSLVALAPSLHAWIRSKVSAWQTAHRRP